MPRFWQRVLLIYVKDLKDEFRNADHLWSTLVFGTMLVFVFSFALQLVDVVSVEVFPAALWVKHFLYGRGGPSALLRQGEGRRCLGCTPAGQR